MVYSLDISDDLLSERRHAGGHIFASSGTSGAPKYVYYSQFEFMTASKNVAKHLAVNGMEPGDRVINYFDAGDLWSGFLLADHALSFLPVTVFPVGHTVNPHNALAVLERFKPNVIMGIPSMILSLARYCSDHGKQIQVQKAFYGGEPMTPSAEDLLRSIWKCELIRSASYASTDAGTIGWQCLHCKSGEHYGFDDTLVEIINDEIVVTSLIRRTMPIIRYRTGDRGKWIAQTCDCAPGAPMFKLLGRVDNAIIIWGSWILYDDVLSTLRELNIDFIAVQANAYSVHGEDLLLVKFETQAQIGPSTENQLRDKSYEKCQDLKQTLAREVLNDHLFFEAAPLGTLKRNHRTGKVIPIIDSRFQP